MAEMHTGGCYCGAVEIEATGEPLDMGYCHCNECRRYCTAPFSIFTLWKPETVKISKGKQLCVSQVRPGTAARGVHVNYRSAKLLGPLAGTLKHGKLGLK